MSSSERHIGILGAGIAGLATAAALQRAGIQCTVLEQATRLGEAGVGIQVTPNASRLFEWLGIAGSLDSVASRPRSIDVRRWDDGTLLARTPLGRDCVDLFGGPYCTLLRADLHRVLLDSLPSGTVQLNSRCVGVRMAEDGPRLAFADGAERQFDVLVGADGIRSVARSALSANSPQFSSQVAYRGLVDSTLVPEFERDQRIRGWFGPEQHCVCYPVSRGRWISFTAMTPAKEPDLGTGDPPSLEDAYRGWDADVVAMLASAQSITRWPLYDVEPLTRWNARGLTLVGDAAHPMLPLRAQGANQAIEDAVVLAECIRTNGKDTHSALNRYQDIRLPRTTELQRSSRESARLFHLGDGDRQLARDKQLSHQWALRSHEWLYGYKAELATA